MHHSVNDRIPWGANYHRTRLAPTPSGFLHLGNILSFSLTAWLAKRSGAAILLRIDDLDRQRVSHLYLQDIFDTLRFLEIPWDEGPTNTTTFEQDYSQVHRLTVYRRALQTLVEKNAVFACSCSRESLAKNGACTCKEKHIPLDAENVSWRIDTSDVGRVSIKDIGGSIISTGLPPEMEHFVVRKKDGFPSYQLSSVVDDLFYNVDLIVRGQDLWPSTVAQHVLAVKLNETNFKDITFVHHGLLTEPSGSKMSKSAGAASIKYLRESGKTSGEIFESIGKMFGDRPLTHNWLQLGEMIACKLTNIVSG